MYTEKLLYLEKIKSIMKGFRVKDVLMSIDEESMVICFNRAKLIIKNNGSIPVTSLIVAKNVMQNKKIKKVKFKIENSKIIRITIKFKDGSKFRIYTNPSYDIKEVIKVDFNVPKKYLVKLYFKSSSFAENGMNAVNNSEPCEIIEVEYDQEFDRDKIITLALRKYAKPYPRSYAARIEEVK